MDNKKCTTAKSPGASIFLAASAGPRSGALRCPPFASLGRRSRGLAPDAHRRPRQGFEPFVGDRLSADVADPVVAVVQLGERPVDLDRQLMKLTCGDRALHLHHCVARVVPCPFAELHLDPGGATGSASSATSPSSSAFRVSSAARMSPTVAISEHRLTRAITAAATADGEPTSAQSVAVPAGLRLARRSEQYRSLWREQGVSVAGETIAATFLFTDLVGSTELSSAMPWRNCVACSTPPAVKPDCSRSRRRTTFL